MPSELDHIDQESHQSLQELKSVLEEFENFNPEARIEVVAKSLSDSVKLLDDEVKNGEDPEESKRIVKGLQGALEQLDDFRQIIEDVDQKSARVEEEIQSEIDELKQHYS
jgi:acylphosphatase